MAGEWTATKWGDIATLAYGKALSGYSDTRGNARVYGTNGPIGWHSEALWDGPGVVVGRKGAYRGVHYTPDPYWVIDTAYSLIPKVDLNLRWAYYQLKHLDVNNIDDGSPIPSTTRDAFYVQDLHLPPREDQDRIARLLSSLDDKIELNRRMAETLEEMARALFKSWFVDFYPVRANAEGRPTGLPAATAALFPDKFGEDGLPEGWRQEALRPSLAQLVTRGITPAYAEDGLVVVNQKCIRNGQIDFALTRRHDEASRRVPDAKLLQVGDIVINSTGTGTLGRVAQVRRLDVSATADTHVTIVRPGRDRVWANYLGLQLVTREAEIERLGDGSTGQTELARDAVGGLPVVVPPDRVLNMFAEITAPMLTHADAALSEVVTLRELRDTLLPKLISGEIRIKDAENAVEAA